jgi:arylsulfatase A-like enzyme
MFTGRWPHELSVGWDRPLDRSSPTLAEFLEDRGYATAGFVANTTYCSYETGLDRGFAHYEDYDVTPRAILLCSSIVQRALNFVHKRPAIARLVGEADPAAGHRKTAARINGDFLAWQQRQPDRPFFAFLNYYDAHHPYLSPEPDRDGDLGAKPESLADVTMLRDWWELDKARLDRGRVALARDSYDRCIAYLDRQIGRLFEELERRGLLRNSLVIITADHGEHFGEQALFGHGASVYLPELHVPLLLIAPGAVPEGRVVAEPVSLRDLAATIADRVGRSPGEPAPFPGRSLARRWSAPAGASPTTDDLPLSEIEAPPEADPNHGASPACRGPLLSLVDRNYHYIRNGDGREELYDIALDPREVNDLARSSSAGDALRRFKGSLPIEATPPRVARGRAGGSGGESSDK